MPKRDAFVANHVVFHIKVQLGLRCAARLRVVDLVAKSGFAGFLERQIALLKPKILLAVGRIAAQNLLRTDVPLGRLRQQAHTFGISRVPLVATYHPAYLLRTPADKRKAWEDLKFAREVCARVER